MLKIFMLKIFMLAAILFANINCALQPVYQQKNQFNKIVLQKPNSRIEQLVYNQIYPQSAQNSQHKQYEFIFNIKLVSDKTELNNEKGEPIRQVIIYQVKWSLEKISQQKNKINEKNKINGKIIVSIAYGNDQQNEYRSFVTKREYKQIIAKEVARQLVDDVNTKIYIQKFVNDRNL